MVVPDYVEPLVGWRVWSAVAAPGGPLLMSLTRPQPWPAGRAIAARCVARAPADRSRRPHVAPVVDCACGIYALASEADAARLVDQARHVPDALAAVLGRVSRWGRVVVHRRGWRAAFAYPLQLFVPSRWCGGIRAADAMEVADSLRRYDVPVEVVAAAGMEAFLDAVRAGAAEQA
jgi:hypothetical protein